MILSVDLMGELSAFGAASAGVGSTFLVSSGAETCGVVIYVLEILTAF